MKKKKICTGCKRGFPATNKYFHRHPLGVNGLHPRCKECQQQKAKQAWARAIGTGLCVICKTAKPERGLTRCTECNRAHLAADRNRKYERRAAGLCIDCGVVAALPEYVRCGDCKEKRNQQLKSERARLVARGICQQCRTRAISPGRTFCQQCLEYASAQQRVRVSNVLAAGYCRECQKQPHGEGSSRCLLCQEKRRAYHQTRRLEVIQGYGATCKCCGEQDLRFLTIDHTNGDGAKERAQYGRSKTRMYTRIVAQGFPDSYQVLCFNCNCAKGIYGICPHRITSP